MVENKKNAIINKVIFHAELSCTSFLSYSNFVSDMEFFSVQYKNELHLSDNQMDAYQEIWIQMEILNAVVLSDWEENGKPNTFSDIWKHKYEKDAMQLVASLICYLRNL